jgi:hypothetical protein
MSTLIFFSFLAAIILVPIYLRSRDRAHLYDTLRLAYERGQPVAPELVEALKAPVRAYEGPERDLRRGLTLSVIGLGFCLIGGALYFGLVDASTEAANITGASLAAIGALPGLVGAAFLILAWVGFRSGKA